MFYRMSRWSRCFRYNWEQEVYSLTSRHWIDIVCLTWMIIMRQTWPEIHLLSHLLMTPNISIIRTCTTAFKRSGFFFFQYIMNWVNCYVPLGERTGNYCIHFPCSFTIFSNVIPALLMVGSSGSENCSGLEIRSISDFCIGGLTSAFCSPIYDPFGHIN